MVAGKGTRGELRGVGPLHSGGTSTGRGSSKILKIPPASGRKRRKEDFGKKNSLLWNPKWPTRLRGEVMLHGRGEKIGAGKGKKSLLFSGEKGKLPEGGVYSKFVFSQEGGPNGGGIQKGGGELEEKPCLQKKKQEKKREGGGCVHGGKGIGS